MNVVTRRDWLAASTALSGAALLGFLGESQASSATAHAAEPFRFCLNTSTISGQKLTLVEELEIAAKAGYAAVEPWLRELDAHVESGKTLKDLGKKIADLGLAIPSAIGFAEWVVDDDAKRAKGVEQMKRDMEKVKAIGGTRIAAPPVGATDQTTLDLRKAAERYREILEIGANIGVVPQLEVWGFSKSISRLGEAAFVAIEANHADACILADVYHLYRGGSNFTGIKLLNGSSLHVFHMNDYPKHPPRSEINDSQRVFPGDGIAPLSALLGDLKTIGYNGYLSLELFNRDYWKLDAAEVAKEGIAKMKAAVASIK